MLDMAENTNPTYEMWHTKRKESPFGHEHAGYVSYLTVCQFHVIQMRDVAVRMIETNDVPEKSGYMNCA